MSEAPRPRRNPVVFRPRFTLMLLYLVGFFFLYALLFALPDLIEAAASLPPGGEEASPEDLERASEVAANALRGGKIQLALLASIVTVGLSAWKGALPGLRP